MLDQDNSEKVKRDRRQRMRRLREWLKDEKAQSALEFLDEYFQLRLPAFQPHNGVADPYMAAFRDGQRNVWEFMKTQAATPLEDDDE
jgi:hypothetical protein